MTDTFDDYSLSLIAMSYPVSALGAFSGLMLSRHIRTEEGSIRFRWPPVS